MSLKKSCGHILFILFLCAVVHAQTFQYMRMGNKEDVQTKASAGTAMMGGGKDLDDAFRWLCNKANGGDFLILRARGDDDYNKYVNDLCKLNSVATLIIPDRKTALDPTVVDIIRHAEAIFVAGGDQALYVNGWRTSPVQDAINNHVAAGKPLGGTSAGLAIQGEYIYTSMNDLDDGPNLSSPMVLKNPYHIQVALARDFLKVPHLQNLITDSHFAKRDRLGRSLVFLARIAQDGWAQNPREIAVDEKSAVLVEPDGKATVIGTGKGAYFIQVKNPPEVCRPNTTLTFRNLATYHGPTGAHFDLTTWNGNGGESYLLSVENGVVHANRPDQSIY
ncbi:MAG TPA: cyanophycinase [Nitrososphaera sp.]|nr:cyanophycinase [Nitrososphaera sp.]